MTFLCELIFLNALRKRSALRLVLSTSTAAAKASAAAKAAHSLKTFTCMPETAAVVEHHMMAMLVVFFPRMVNGKDRIISPAIAPTPCVRRITVSRVPGVAVTVATVQTTCDATNQKESFDRSQQSLISLTAHVMALPTPACRSRGRTPNPESATSGCPKPSADGRPDHRGRVRARQPYPAPSWPAICRPGRTNQFPAYRLH